MHSIDNRLAIVIVGPGRLGRTVSLALEARGHKVTLLGRGERIPTAPLTWLTVPDRSIAQASAAVPRMPEGGVVLHASGACDLDVLRPHIHRGSLHPLMTFPGPELASPDFDGLPAALDGDPLARQMAGQLAEALGWRAFGVNGDRRLYHASAVMAGNFSTVLLAAAADLLEAAGVPAQDAPALLLPLARASLENAAAVGPARALTGPVARGDEDIIRAHRSAIADARPHLLPVYDALATTARRLLDPPRQDGEAPAKAKETGTS
ncbi:MAG: DUF2520 domain-containing protein [Oligoflexia bacterium]|nr:DUF2520 domain-containing protein [Oligoflexia bacterium]